MNDDLLENLKAIAAEPNTMELAYQIMLSQGYYNEAAAINQLLYFELDIDGECISDRFLELGDYRIITVVRGDWVRLSFRGKYTTILIGDFLKRNTKIDKKVCELIALMGTLYASRLAEPYHQKQKVHQLYYQDWSVETLPQELMGLKNNIICEDCVSTIRQLIPRNSRWSVDRPLMLSWKGFCQCDVCGHHITNPDITIMNDHVEYFLNLSDQAFIKELSQPDGWYKMYVLLSGPEKYLYILRLKAQLFLKIHHLSY